MTSQQRRAAIAFAFVLAAMAAAAILWLLGVEEPFTPDVAVYLVAYVAFAAVGALILGQQPANRIGQLCLLTGLLGAAVAPIDTYARLAMHVPLREWAAWTTAWAFPLTFGPILAVLLLFPTGSLASRRWRPVAWMIALGVALIGVGAAFTPAFADFPHIPNPLGISWLTGSPIDQGGVGWLLILVAVLATAVGLVLRLRRARGVERQQLKLVTSAAALNGISWLILALDLPGIAGQIATLAVFVTFATVPIAIGVAMLRYRLYDFDLVIRRTLVYGVVAVALAAVYVAGVLVLQAVLAPFTANNSLAVAGSTLVVIGLFGPVRRRAQGAVDRRFYRSRYDAQRTLDAFAARVRDEVDLDRLSDELRTAAIATLRPASASVWLKERTS